MSRTLLVATSSAGLILGGALSAGASERDGGHGDHRDWNWGKGWVKVCQTVKDDHRYPRDDHRYGGKDDGYKNDRTSGYDDTKSKMDSRYRYDDHDRDYNRYEGRYLVRDSRGKGYWVTLKGKSDCETVRVNKGWAKVSVINRPDNTWLKSDRSVWVKVKKYDTATANFYYQAKRDYRHDDNHDHHYDSAHR